MRYKLIDFFTDPILRAPMLGSLCMCLAASLIGVCVFLRKKSLLGETLSHASYPGLMVSALLLSYGAKGLQDRFFFVFLLGAWIASMMGLLFMTKLQKKFLVKSDAALCFTLASFFGVGVLLASCLQFSHPAWYRQVQVFLYGQTATLLDEHVKIYAMFLILVLLFLLIFYRPIRIAYFDPSYAQSIGISMRKMDLCFFVLLGLGVTIAMKSIGIVLLSGMLIAPALGARQITSKLSKLLVIAAILGTLSAFTGNYFSVKISEWLPEQRLLFPTGPMIVLCSSLFTGVLLLITHTKRARSAGFFSRVEREKLREKVLLCILGKAKEGMQVQEMACYLRCSKKMVVRLLQKNIRLGLVRREGTRYLL